MTPLPAFEPPGAVLLTFLAFLVAFSVTSGTATGAVVTTSSSKGSDTDDGRSSYEYLGWSIVVAGDASGEALMVIGPTVGSASAFEVRASAGTSLREETGDCDQVDPATVRCRPAKPAWARTVRLGSVTVSLGAGDDRLTIQDVGGALAQFAGGDGDDSLVVAAGAPSQPVALSGGSGDDRLVGGSAADRFVGGAGADVIDGRGGADLVSYEDHDASVSVDLGTPAGAAGAAGERDVLAGVEGAEGGAGADLLVGDDADNKLDGGPGDDRLAGMGGADELEGQAGSDGLDGGAGKDFLRDGGGGPDRLLGGQGRDELEGGDGDDRLEGGSAGDRLTNSGGRDVMIAGPGDDEFSLGDGRGGPGQRDVADGGPGNDTFDLDSHARPRLPISLRCGAGRDIVHDPTTRFAIPAACETVGGTAYVARIDRRVRWNRTVNLARLRFSGDVCVYGTARCRIRAQLRSTDGRRVLAQAEPLTLRERAAGATLRFRLDAAASRQVLRSHYSIRFWTVGDEREPPIAWRPAASPTRKLGPDSRSRSVDTEIPQQRSDARERARDERGENERTTEPCSIQRHAGERSSRPASPLRW